MNTYPQGVTGWGRRFAQDHPVLGDLVVVAVALGAAWASVFYVAELYGWGWAVALGTLPALALFGRRRAPFTALGVSVAVELVQWVLRIPVNGTQIALVLGLYSIARHQNASRGRIALGLGLALVALAPLRQPYQGAGNTLVQALFLILVWVLGTNIALRQGYLQALEERAERLERERDAAARSATLTERTRIAREMHDVVAHHVSVMVVQAEGASWAVDTAPDQARSAVRTIAETGRSTLVELRRLLGVLRDTEAGEEVAPQPELARLPDLVEHFRRSGLEVQFGATPVTGVPDGVQLAVYRVAQEGLTNVLKHAGVGTRVAVDVMAEPGQIRVEVTDSGQGGVRTRGETSAPGHGLVGIRERAALFGGRTQIGPTPAGGFAVRAWFPLEPA